MWRLIGSSARGEVSSNAYEALPSFQASFVYLTVIFSRGCYYDRMRNAANSAVHPIRGVTLFLSGAENSAGTSCADSSRFRADVTAVASLGEKL